MDLDLARNWTDILIGGIDFDLPGNGGDECWNFMTLKRRLFETIFGLVVLSSALIIGKMGRKDEFKQSNRYDYSPSYISKPTKKLFHPPYLSVHQCATLFGMF